MSVILMMASGDDGGFDDDIGKGDDFYEGIGDDCDFDDGIDDCKDYRLHR